MTRFQRKPFEVDAAQMPPKDVWLNYRNGHTAAIPKGLIKLFMLEEQKRLTELDMGIMVDTPNGSSLAEPGMWILRDELGNLHVMTHELFIAAYDELQELKH